MNTFQRIRKSGGKVLVLISFVLAFQGILGASSANAACVSMDELAAMSPSDGTYDTCGGDDLSYKIPISGSVIFGGVTYTSVYATVNSTITFGQPDGTFSTFPETPSISLDSIDWVADGFVQSDGTDFAWVNRERTDEFFKITVAGNTFRVDMSVRPYSTYLDSGRTSVTDQYGTYLMNDFSKTLVPQGSATRLILNFVRLSDGTLRITSFSSDATDTALRNGCVLSEGAAAISLADCGILEVATVEAILNEMPENYLVATTPLVVSQTKDAITCTSATLKYMADGVETGSPKLTAQTYAVKVDGKIVAQKATLDSSASFDKKLLPSSGVATCSQTATQNGSQVNVESEISTAAGDAAKLRKAEVAKILSEFKIQAQKLMVAKTVQLSSGSGSAYRAATEQWKADLLEAQDVRDAAIAAAYAKATKAAFDAGTMVNIG